MGGERNVYRVLMGKTEGKRPLGRRRHRWEDGIRMDLREIGWGSVDWIQLAVASSDIYRERVIGLCIRNDDTFLCKGSTK
jgi:hypothetical protein